MSEAKKEGSGVRWAYVIPLAYVGTIVGIGIWAAVDPKGMMKTTRKGRKLVEEKTGARLPRPDIMVLGPDDEDGFDAFDEVLCETAIEVNVEQPGLMAEDPNAFMQEVSTRVLKKMLPDYPWPATTGDHPTAAELQGLVKYEVRRSFLDKTLCLTGEDLDVYEDIEEDTDFVPVPGEG